MSLRTELLKSVWYAFTSLDTEKSGKVSKSQLKVQYLLQKLLTAARSEIGEIELGEILSSLGQGISVWQFLDLVTLPKILQGISTETLSMAIQDLYEEIIQDVLKQGYLLKKANLRRTWTERWFVLKQNVFSYYVSEECKEKKGTIAIDRDCGVEILSDRDGRRCMFCIKTSTKTHEMSASDTKHRQEWVTAIQTAIRLQQSGSISLNRELQSRRREQREQREQRRLLKEQEMQRLAELQNERERQQNELEQLREAQKKAEEAIIQEQNRQREQQEEMQRLLAAKLKEAEEARASMQAEMQQKELEALRQRQRIQELEQLQDRLQEALAQEIKARQDEEEYRRAQAKLLVQEEDKLQVLLRMQEEQAQFVERAQREKQELQQEMEIKNRELQEAQKQLEDVRENRQRADLDVQVAQRKLHQASTNVRHWNVQMNRLMHPISPGEKRTASAGGFQGLWGPSLARQDSSIKRLQMLEGKETPQSNEDQLENSVNL
ncbi:differentially expressed in FDCP 6 homolog isoform X5 [Pyxicephalus adspersus]|uniref:differentially expressed in FDCP 6 homolog isoform X5 n=1 Tax=Pyxicephalus adspersus TaxID=30357 RepID=UPI003B59AAD7